VNLVSVELDARLDEHGFRHAATSVGERLGSRRGGAAVYDADAGVPIWPYHYHHGIEEWLYVITGAPVLREPAGERTLAPADLVCFPSGPAGAHTLSGPGRFVIFSTGREPYLSVYPDSDKISGPGGILLRSAAVDYWHGEGTAGPLPPVAFAREPEGAVDPGPAMLTATIVDSVPYHYVHGREEWLLVLAGTPTLRHARGEDQLVAGDLVCFPEGPDGAHGLSGSSGVRALLLSTTDLPANVFYPDSGEWRIRNGADDDVVLRPTL